MLFRLQLQLHLHSSKAIKFSFYNRFLSFLLPHIYILLNKMPSCYYILSVSYIYLIDKYRGCGHLSLSSQSREPFYFINVCFTLHIHRKYFLLIYHSWYFALKIMQTLCLHFFLWLFFQFVFLSLCFLL